MANRNGIYTVKSGYWVAKDQEKDLPIKDPGMSYVVPNSLWKNVWRLSIPPKIQHFVWRICVGAVATRSALFKRKCAVNPMCPICLVEEETLEHLLFLCPWTKSCWFGYPLGIKFNRWTMRRCDAWLCDMLCGVDLLDDYGKALLANMCWWIWKERCQ